MGATVEGWKEKKEIQTKKLWNRGKKLAEKGQRKEGDVKQEVMQDQQEHT